VKHENEPNVPVANCACSAAACFPMMRLNICAVMMLALFTVLLILYIYCATDDSIYKAVHDYFLHICSVADKCIYGAATDCFYRPMDNFILRVLQIAFLQC
jgi:hypothetical protein